LDAIGRLEQSGIINKSDADFMKKAYVFYRTIESYLRLREKDVLKKSDGDILSAVAEFLGCKDGEELIQNLEETRAKVRDIYDTLVV
ncbi:MAG: hypothetical protein Q8M71_11810, partial [Thermodesulfovibrionales bacterium]|nr:hypothetical protein [Thermodesulfovibrionales bacterium]